MDRIQNWIFCLKILFVYFMLMFVCISTKAQVISDVYRKKFYTKIPHSWISPKQKLEIITTSRKILKEKWKIQEIKLENYLKKKEIHSFKCYPPFSMKIVKKNIKKIKNFKNVKKILLQILLIVYPRSYRNTIEDPLEPPPLNYLGSNKKLAFYFHAPHKKNEEEKGNITKKKNDTSKLIKILKTKIVKAFYLK